MSEPIRKHDTIVRCVTIPIGGPGEGRSWEELNKGLHAAWRLSTDAANWCVHALFRRDIPGAVKMPATVKSRGKNNPCGFYAYQEFLKAVPEALELWKGQKQSMNICLRYAERKYQKERFNVMVRHVSNLLTVRYPYPFPLDADAWKLEYESGGGFPIVHVSLPGRDRYSLRIKRGSEFGRQLAMLRKINDGTAKKGEAAIYRNRKGDVLLKMVGHFPRESRSERVHACLLHTDPNALLVAEIVVAESDGRRPVIWNADHIRRMNAHHRIYLQRSSEDMKREHRMDKQQRSNFLKAREERCAKHNDRMNTAIYQIAAQVGRFVERQKVATVAYDDSIKAYMPEGFRWHALTTRLRNIFDGMGVEFIDGTSTEGG